MSNGKLSEPAAAFILARHLSDPNWAPAYRQQFERILGIAREQGFRLLVDEKSIGRGAYGNLPLISSFAIGEDCLPNDVTNSAKILQASRALRNCDESIFEDRQRSLFIRAYKTSTIVCSTKVFAEIRSSDREG